MDQPMFFKKTPVGRIDFAHIAPTAFLDKLTITNKLHLVLAHLVEQNPQYRDFYLNQNKFKIMDNSAFEMFKQGRPMLDRRKLIDLAQACHADMIVMSDYPREHSYKTIKAAMEMAPAIKDAGYQTFFCPQSEDGSVDDLLRSIDWALQNDDIDRIGISILNAPVALGVAESTYQEINDDPTFRMQRYLARWTVFDMMDRCGWLKEENAQKRFHCLGMTEGPKEILLLQPFAPAIASWDSSAAVWAGLNGIAFDCSPTGLTKGKFDKEVDFEFTLAEDDAGRMRTALHNIDMIDEYLREVDNAYRVDRSERIGQGHRCLNC